MPHDIYEKDLREDLRALIKELVEDQPARSYEPGMVLVRQEKPPAPVALFEHTK